MADENEDILQKLAPSIVEIISEDKEGEENPSTLGTGFVVTDDGLVVTCRHVIADSQDKLMNFVKVRFHTDGKTDLKYTASPIREDQNFEDDPSIDIAFLRLNKLPEKDVSPVKLDDKIVSLNQFASIGFKKAKEFKWLSARGDIGIPTEIKSSKGLPSPEAIELHSSQIEPGMSGAPVLDIERDRVVGIISQRYKEEYNPAVSNMAFALPVKSMLELYPMLREKNQGLTVLSNFLRAIGEEGSSIYKWIDEVYVPPTEYDDIKETLKGKRVLFITGTKEFGKTFTAVNLMYEYFKEGNYQPRWIHERKQQGLPEGSDPQELARIMQEEGYIKPHQIVYFEDPFGKTQYERSSDLENYIGSIIDSIRNVQDAYIIITSREEVFKEFGKEKLSSVELEKFEKKLNLKRASYDVERRKGILLRWAKVTNCKWLPDPALKKLVIEAIENQQLLPTPLNIKDFVKASRNILAPKQLRDLLKLQSEDTIMRFADEIMRMKEDEKVLFLAFPYIGRGTIDIDLAKIMYESIIIDWRESNQKYYMDFERVKKWFEGDKINISESEIAYSHPSYDEAFQHAIRSEKHQSEMVKSVFAKLLLKLANENKSIRGVAYAIAENFDKLPPTVHQLLFKLADNDETAWKVVQAIIMNFDKLPPTVHQLLFKIADNDINAGPISTTIIFRFHSLPPTVHQLLFKIADNDETAFLVGASISSYLNEAIRFHLDPLPTKVLEQLLFKLADKDKAAFSVALVIGRNFDKLPPTVHQLLFKLADKDKNAWYVASAIAENFDKLPPTVHQLLFKLADKDKTASGVASAISKNFNKLPANVREQLLLKLVDKRSAARIVSSVIKDSNNNYLPEDMRKEIPEEIRNKILTKLKKGHRTRGRLRRDKSKS